jgi:hypothetical protein
MATSTRKAKKWLLAAFIWIAVAGALAGLGKHYLAAPNENPPREDWVTVLPEIGPIVFPRGEAKPEIGSDVPLGKLADLLTAHAGYRVRIVGHIGPDSDPASGRELAEKRANGIKQSLADKDVAADRIVVETSEKADSAGRYNSVSCVMQKKK